MLGYNKADRVALAARADEGDDNEGDTGETGDAPTAQMDHRRDGLVEISTPMVLPMGETSMSGMTTHSLSVPLRFQLRVHPAQPQVVGLEALRPNDL